MRRKSMRHTRPGNHYGDRIKKIVRDSMETDFVREAGDRIKSFVTGQPIVSACLGLAAGIMLGMLIRRRD
jgi:predicted PurR-regulated permease PerM